MSVEDTSLSPTLPKVNCISLPNKLKCILAKEDSNPVLCLQIYIRTGSVKESPGQLGYSHFLEHLCFKSTKDFPSNGLSRYAFGIGGMLNAFTDYDCTCYYILLPAEKLDAGIMILSQLVMYPSLLKEDVDSEKDIIIEEIKQYENDPEQDFIEYVQVQHFDQSPLKRPVLGDISSIRHANRRKLTDFYLTHYNPQNAFMVISGNFEESCAKVSIDKYFANWGASASCSLNTIQSTEPELPISKRLFRKKSTGEEMLAITFPELCEAHPLSDALLIAMRYLAIGKSSRLFKRLVEEDRLCSSVKVNSLSGLLSGISVVLICPIGKKNFERILAIVREEYQMLRMHLIPSDDLNLIKKDIIHSWIYSFEGVENIANQFAAEEFIGNLDNYQSYCQKISSIPAEEVRSAVNRYWVHENLSLYHQGVKAIVNFRDFSFAEYADLHDRAESKSHNLLLDIPTGKDNYSECVVDNIQQISEHHYQITLSNGMRVLYKRHAGTSVSGFAASSHLSQLCENGQQRGLNFFCSTLMLYGTENYSHEQLMRFSREHGFNIRVLHHLDSTTFRGKCQTANLEQALGLLSEIVLRPRFDAGHLKLLKDSALDGIRRDNDYPVSYAYQKWFQMLVGKESNLYRSTGNAMDIRAITLRDIASWYRSWNISSDFCLGIVSSLEPHAVAEICNKYFCGIRKSNVQLQANARWQASKKLYKKQHRKTDQAIIHLGGFATAASSREENAAFHVLSHILGGDISSRFFDVIREQHAIAYQTGFDFSSINELGFWNAYAFCDQKFYKQCIAFMKDIILDVRRDGIAKYELEDAVKYLISMNRFDSESVSYTASSMASLAALGYEADYYYKREARLMSVSLELVNHVAERAFRDDNQYLHILV